MGYKHRDCNGEFQTGFMHAQGPGESTPLKGLFSLYFIYFSFLGTVRQDQRCSTNKAFLRPVRNRANLHISKNSYVTKIIIDPSSKRATGVRFEKNGKVYQIGATKEVVMSAGVIATPQILMVINLKSIKFFFYSIIPNILTTVEWDWSYGPFIVVRHPNDC